MTNRREFLQTAAALSAAPLAGRAGLARGRDAVIVEAVILDERHAEAIDFGNRAGHLGAALRIISGDITELWQNELRTHWKTTPTAIAGLTERPALFLLERLAWDYGLRVVFEAEHEPDARGHASHRVIRTADSSLTPELNAAGRRWPNVLADALLVGNHVPTNNFKPSDAAMAAHYGESTEKLYSWIIAPRTAV